MTWETSASFDAIAGPWVSALGELEDVTRAQTADTGAYSYRYADLAAVLGVIRPTLARHALAAFQTVAVDGEDVTVETTVWHTSGQWLRFPPLRIPAGRTAQSTGSAISYGRRYALMAQFGLATEDDDGAAAGVCTDPPAPPEPPLLAHPNTIAQFRGQARARGFDAAGVARLVLAATGDRTTDPEQVYATEVDGLRAALAAGEQRQDDDHDDEHDDR